MVFKKTVFFIPKIRGVNRYPYFTDLRGYIREEVNHSNFRILSLTEHGWRPIEDEGQTLDGMGLGPRAALQLAPMSHTFEEINKHIGRVTSLQYLPQNLGNKM